MGDLNAGKKIMEDTESKITVPDDSSSEVVDDSNAEVRIADKDSSETETVEDSNAESKTTNSSDLENEHMEDVSNKDYEDLFQKSNNVAKIFSRYLTRCYDIFKRGSSEIEDDHSLPRHCKTLLGDAIQYYKSTEYLGIFLPIANLENRLAELKTTFTKGLINRGNVLSYSEFLRFSALYILTAYDLKETKEFDEAPDCAVHALTEAMMTTNQRWWLHFWYP